MGSGSRDRSGLCGYQRAGGGSVGECVRLGTEPCARIFDLGHDRPGAAGIGRRGGVPDVKQPDQRLIQDRCGLLCQAVFLPVAGVNSVKILPAGIGLRVGRY